MATNTNPNTTRETLNAVIQDTRFRLIQTILAHPKQQPSLKEISEANPSKSTSTIREHLQQLIKYDIVEIVTLDKEDRTRDLPWKFYAITGHGYRFLQDHDLLMAEKSLREIYSRVDKNQIIKKYENAPRPHELDEDNSGKGQESLKH